MELRRVLAFGSVLALASLYPQAGTLAQQQEEAQEAPDYSAMAREDIEGAYAIFAQHHPGMYNPLDPEFGERLARARDEALELAEIAVDSEGHMRAVEALSNSLADGHALAVVAYNGSDVRWPGFDTQWRGEALFVARESEGGPPIGAALVSCDGIDANTLIREDILLSGGRVGEAGQWWEYGGSFFLRVPSRYHDFPETCLFRDHLDELQSYRLDWRPVPHEYWQQFFDQSDRLPVGLTEPRRGMYLFSMPTFSPGEEDQAAYEAIFASLPDQIEDIRSADAIILDLRWNSGGSDTWPRRLAGHLWGGNAVSWARANFFQGTEIWQLADDANIAHWTERAAVYRERGILPIAEALEDYVVNMSGARERGDTFYRDDFGTRLLAEATPAEPRDLPPVYVITDGGCASACLDAVDTFSLFHGVKLIGAPTSADTEYLETRSQPLPSGRGRVILPTKIWVNRPRGSGEVYNPDILVTDLEWSTEVFLDHIERDLSQH